MESQGGKVCRGFYHAPGTLLPLSEFNTRKSGDRKGELYSLCRVCHKHRRKHPISSPGSAYVPMSKFMEVYDELVRRIGQTNMAKRIGVAVDTLNRRRLATKTNVRVTTYETALAVLEDARSNGEDGWDADAVRVANLTPEIAWQKSAEVRRLRKKAENDWQLEMAMDRGVSDRAWSYPDKNDMYMRLADFECQHDRLPGDLTPPCGCWPEEGQV